MSGEAVAAGLPAGVCPVELWSDDFNVHFWDQIGDLQRTSPMSVHKQGETPCWFATRYEDVWAILRDWKTFTSTEGVAILGGDNRAEPPKNEGRFLPEDLDPPAHAEWRRLMNPELTVERVAKYEPAIRDTVDELLRPLLRVGRFRVMEDFLRPLQLRTVFSQVLRLPDDEIDEWIHWGHDIFVGETAELAAAAYTNMYQGVERLITSRKAHPLEDDIVSIVCGAETINGREPTMAELVAAIIPLAIAGLESNGTILGGIIHHLATHPADREELVNDRSLIPAAVEEGLRMFANVTVLQRTVTVPVSVAGVALQPGDKVWPSYNAANRDAAQFPDPHTWNLHRENSRQITFSVGPHRCPGSNFARLTLSVTLEEFLARVPSFALAADQEIKYFSMPTRGIHEFSIVFAPQDDTQPSSPR